MQSEELLMSLPFSLIDFLLSISIAQHPRPTNFTMPKLDSGGTANVATAIVFVFLDSVAVFLRLLSKSKTKHYFSSDDQWILAALLFFYAWSGQIFYGQSRIQRVLLIGPKPRQLCSESQDL
ncbi:MAG: hypothetical protein Q9171_004836 [Xanthocarpia ochracea]